MFETLATDGTRFFLSWVWKLGNLFNFCIGADRKRPSKYFEKSLSSFIGDVTHVLDLHTFYTQTPFSAVREGSLVSLSLTFLQKGFFH